MLKFRFLKFRVLTILLISNLVLAQNQIMERVFEGSSTQESAQLAKKEIQDQAIAKISEEFIKELIGEQKFNKNRSVIQNRIIRNSASYIPFSKTGELKKIAEKQFQMTVQLKVSIDSLRTLLFQNGLVYEMEGQPIVLYFLNFNNKDEKKFYNWWAQDRALEYQSIYQNIEKQFAKSLWKNNFYFIEADKNKYAHFLPQFITSKRDLSFDDKSYLIQYYNTLIAINGDVVVYDEKIEINLRAEHTQNNRIIAEVIRKFEYDESLGIMGVEKKLNEVFEQVAVDLSNQIQETWQRGVFDSKMVKLTFLGKIQPSVIESLKQELKSITAIKAIKERLISSSDVTFEVETTQSAQELAQKLKTFNSEKNKFILQNQTEQQIYLELTK